MVSDVLQRTLASRGQARRVNEIRMMYLPRLLKWDDRNSMAFSIEGRYPFLDHELIELCLSFAPEILYHHGWTKWPLRRGLQNALPDKVAPSPKQIRLLGTSRPMAVRCPPPHADSMAGFRPSTVGFGESHDCSKACRGDLADFRATRRARVRRSCVASCWISGWRSSMSPDTPSLVLTQGVSELFPHSWALSLSPQPTSN